MTQKIQKFLQKHKIETTDIKYILRQQDQTLIYLLDQEPVSTYLSARIIVEHLKPGYLISVNKSVYLNTHFVINIDKNLYTMIDNRKFKGRYHKTEEQKQFEYKWKSTKNSPDFSSNYLSHLTIFDDCPVGFCIIEIVFDKEGSGVDFIFRYCNRKMEEIEEIPVEEMVGHSFRSLFHGDGLKWLASYTDVAMNNTQKTIHAYSPGLNKYLSVYCFQVKERFCGCFVLNAAETAKDILSRIQSVSTLSLSLKRKK